MNEEDFSKYTYPQDLQYRQADQAKRKPAKAIYSNMPGALGNSVGQECSYSAKDQPVKQNEGNNKFIPIKLG